MSKLRIYACSGTGSQQQATFTNEGTSAISNTQAMNSLLSLINMCAANAQLVTTGQDERLQCYRDMDIYSVCFYFAQLYAGNDQMLREAGYAINQYLQDGKFNLNSADLTEHGSRVDEIINGIQELLDNEDYSHNESSFVTWWMESIVAKNTVGIKPAKQEAARQAVRKAKGSSWKDNEDLNTYLNDGGTYFLYTYFTEDQLRQLPAIVRKKRAKQLEVYKYCKQCFVPLYGSEQDMRRIISNSIKFQFKASPEDVCSDIVNGKRSIGALVFDDIMAIITLIVSVILALLPLLLNYCAAVAIAEYTVPEDPSAGVATEDDYAGWSPKKKNSNLWLWIAGAAAALFLIR